MEAMPKRDPTERRRTRFHDGTSGSGKKRCGRGRRRVRDGRAEPARCGVAVTETGMWMERM